MDYLIIGDVHGSYDKLEKLVSTVHQGEQLVFYWKNTPEEDFLWIREWFHRTPNITEKTVVFGHTPTFFLHGEQTNEVWDSRSTGKIGIDGAAFSEGGLLHAIKVKNGRKSFRNYFVDDELNFHARVYI